MLLPWSFSSEQSFCFKDNNDHNVFSVYLTVDQMSPHPLFLTQSISEVLFNRTGLFSRIKNSSYL